MWRSKSFTDGIDNILTIKKLETAPKFEKYRHQLARMQKHIWGVSTQSFFGSYLEEIRFTLVYQPEEEYIVRRILREKRCGQVEIKEGEISFSVQVYDANELIPWICSFICRIKEIEISPQILRKRFLEDLEAMYRIYDVEREEDDI